MASCLVRVCGWTSGCLASSLVLLLALVWGLERRDALYPGYGIDMPSSLVGRVAVVTGSSSGIGYEAASILLNLGAQVIVHSPSQERAAASAASLLRNATAGAGRATPLAADLADFDEVRKMANQLRALTPRVDLLFLNAGFMYGPHPGANGSERAFTRPDSDFLASSGHDKVLAANHMGHQLLAEMIKTHLSPGARIVVMGSQGAWNGQHARLLPPWGGVGKMRFADVGAANPKRILWHLKNMRQYAYLAYWDSKLANVCLARSLRRRWKNHYVALHDPGLVTAGTTSARDSRVYTKRLYRYSGWTPNNRAPVYDGGMHLVQSAFVTRRPLPDCVTAFFHPREVFRWLAPPSMHPWRRRPLKWFIDRQKLTWGLHAGVAPDCGDEAFQDAFIFWSAKEMGLVAA